MVFNSDLAGAIAAIWLGSIVLSAWIADQKGRPMINWIALAALFGPVALVAVASAQPGLGLGFKECIECLEPIKEMATTCPHWRTDLIPAERAERAPITCRAADLGVR